MSILKLPLSSCIAIIFSLSLSHSTFASTQTFQFPGPQDSRILTPLGADGGEVRRGETKIKSKLRADAFCRSKRFDYAASFEGGFDDGHGNAAADGGVPSAILDGMAASACYDFMDFKLDGDGSEYDRRVCDDGVPHLLSQVAVYHIYFLTAITCE